MNPDKPTIPIVINPDFSAIEDLCFKRCVKSLRVPRLSLVEKNCLDHCYMKHMDALKHTKLCLGYLRFKVMQHDGEAREKLSKNQAKMPGFMKKRMNLEDI